MFLESFATNYPNAYKVFSFALKALLVLFIIVWSAIQIYFNIVPFEMAVDNFEQATNFNTDQIRNQGTVFSNPMLSDVYFAVFSLLFITATLSALLSLALLSQNRSLLEIFLLFLTFAIPRQRKYWGKVYHKATGAPAAFAAVRLWAVDDAGKEQIVEQTVTDLDGRYRILLSRSAQSKYILEVQTSEMQPVRQPVTFDVGILGKREVIEDVALDSATQIVTHDVWWRVLRRRLRGYFIIYIYIFNFIAFAHSLYGLLAFPQIDTIIYLVLYGYGLAWNTVFIRQRLGRTQGYVKDKYTKQPITGVQVTFFQGNKAVASAITDEDGYLKVPLPAGIYTVQAGVQGYDMAATSTGEALQVRLGQDGLILSDISMIRNSEATSVIGQKLANPFGG